MMGLAYWEKAWENARARSPVAPGNTDGAGWLSYWDYVAEQYAGPGEEEDPSDSEIIEYLRREGVFRPGDRVLDIGCGAGAYALQFAREARSVLGIDPSKYMLSKLMAAAGRLPEGSVSAQMTRWEDFDPGDRYDLVFTAFCPGVHNPETLWKMEACSGRSCCYIAGDRSHFRLLDQLWAELFGEPGSCDVYDVAYPLNLLYSAGRKPNLRFFRSESGWLAPSEQLVEEYTLYFDALAKTGPSKREAIKRFIEARTVDGCVEMCQSYIVCVLHWDIPDVDASHV